MTPSDQTKLYKAKAIDSFKTKTDLFIFSLVTQNKQLNDEEFIDEFKDKFEIDQSIVTEYTTQYWKKDRKDKWSNGKSIDEIYIEMKSIWGKKDAINKCQEHYIVSEFEKIFPKDKFIELVTDSQKCYYCKVSKDEIDLLTKSGKIRTKRERGFKFEIDRLNPNTEYTKDNCRMCCYWCNNAKTDEFTAEEFLEIAKGITKMWKERLAKEYVFEKIN